MFFLQEQQAAINDGFANRFAVGQDIDLQFKVALGVHPSNPGVAQPLVFVTATGLNAAKTQQIMKTISALEDGWDRFGVNNILSLSSSVAQTPTSAPGTYHIRTTTQKSTFKNVKLSRLKVFNYCPFTGWQQSYNWNGYNLNDPITDSYAGICRAPKANTSGSNDPIEIVGSSTADRNKLTVNIPVK